MHNRQTNESRQKLFLFAMAKKTVNTSFDGRAYLHINSSQDLLNIGTTTNFSLQQFDQRTGKCIATTQHRDHQLIIYHPLNIDQL